MKGMLVSNDLYVLVVWLADMCEEARQEPSNPKIANTQDIPSKASKVTKYLHATAMVSLRAWYRCRKSTVGRNIVEAFPLAICIDGTLISTNGFVGPVASEIDHSRSMAQNTAVAASQRWGPTILRHVPSRVAILSSRSCLIEVVMIVVLIIWYAVDTQRTVGSLDGTVRLLREVDHIHAACLLVVVVVRTRSPICLMLWRCRPSGVELAVPDDLDKLIVEIHLCFQLCFKLFQAGASQARPLASVRPCPFGLRQPITFPSACRG